MPPDEALAGFEAAMLARSRPAVLASRAAALDYHRPGALGCALRDARLWLAGRALDAFG